MAEDEYINELSRALGIRQRNLLERDILLHQLLKELSRHPLFSERCLFKGGTCLIKGYTGYGRFSVDLDFTWREQGLTRDMTGSERAAYISERILEFGRLLEEVAQKLHLDFRFVKSDEKYVLIRGGGKYCKFKLWFHSTMTDTDEIVKVEVNFVELLCFTPTVKDFRSLITGKNHEVMSLFPDYSWYEEVVTLPAYTIEEITCEKVRAIFTRHTVKARDIFDIYLISTQCSVDVAALKEMIIEKILFSFSKHERSQEHYKRNRELILSEAYFSWGDEMRYLLVDLDEEAFFIFLQSFNQLLADLIEEIDCRLTT